LLPGENIPEICARIAYTIKRVTKQPVNNPAFAHKEKRGSEILKSRLPRFFFLGGGAAGADYQD